MYGGGFAAIPAYLADVFGTGSIGAIHGRLLTAWSVAGILGPVLVNYVNQWQLRAGVPPARAYDRTMFMLASLLAAGLLANLAIRSPQTARNPTKTASDIATRAIDNATTADTITNWPIVITFWLLVAVPLGWGTWQTLRQASALFW